MSSHVVHQQMLIQVSQASYHGAYVGNQLRVNTFILRFHLFKHQPDAYTGSQASYHGTYVDNQLRVNSFMIRFHPFKHQPDKGYFLDLQIVFLYRFSTHNKERVSLRRRRLNGGAEPR